MRTVRQIRVARIREITVSPHEDPIELVDSQYAAWRARYDRDRLERLFDRRDLRDTVYRIEHVGSTAVPDLAAKDVVDLDIVVADRAVGTVSSAIESTLGGTRHENSEVAPRLPFLGRSTVQ
ncbi:GrpB family protein [Halovivax gelatinilyticus]|uniref:GrpB family protein n=1 Tax=Halovivax gelatinilyticus TaxID=2961597 RepID=UPI0020CA6D6D|nr:GrpB family protein [Halovivax gelatinilyticus]